MCRAASLNCIYVFDCGSFLRRPASATGGRRRSPARGFGVDVGTARKPPKTAVQSHFNLGSQVDRDALMLY